MARRLAFVTGCDEKFYLLTTALLSSFAEHCPNHTLWVCDYGLTAPQQARLRSRHVLLERPRDVPAGEHPWFYKAQLAAYAEPLDADWLVWLDSDCLITGPLASAVAGVLDASPASGEVVAICQGRIGSTFARVAALAGPAGLLARDEIPGDTPYFNIGVFVARAPALLAAWADQIGGAPRQGMFEQNLLNVLLYRGGVNIIPLDHDVWNVTHHALGECAVTGSTVVCRNKPVLVVHATGAYRDARVSIDDVSGTVRVLNNPGLWELQQAALTRWHGGARVVFLPEPV